MVISVWSYCCFLKDFIKCLSAQLKYCLIFFFFLLTGCHFPSFLLALKVGSWRQMNNLCCEFYFSQLLMACWVPSCYAVSAYVFTAWLKQKERKYSHIFFLFFLFNPHRGFIKPFFFVAEALTVSPQRLSPWVGLRKINVSYWGWEDMTPFTNSSLRWLPGEPSDSGFCAYLEEPQVSGLRANPCTANAHGLICEKATGESTLWWCLTECVIDVVWN